MVRWQYDAGDAPHGNIALPADRQSLGGVVDGSVLELEHEILGI